MLAPENGYWTRRLRGEMACGKSCMNYPPSDEHSYTALTLSHCTRSLLLPNLISGAMDVPRLEIETKEPNR